MGVDVYEFSLGIPAYRVIRVFAERAAVTMSSS